MKRIVHCNKEKKGQRIARIANIAKIAEIYKSKNNSSRRRGVAENISETRRTGGSGGKLQGLALSQKSQIEPW